jgi:predicted amino acid-binding ACT domain protein
MTNESAHTQVFSGLILLTGEDKPGLADALFEALSPFAVSIIDIDQIVISSRLILTVQISLNQAHQGAIESDLELLAQRLEIDIASVFDFSDSPSPMKHDATIRITASKLLHQLGDICCSIFRWKYPSIQSQFIKPHGG